ncbi:hypothetical protein AB0M29_13035 [Streptomyces sp. NPDC051976]|uniref:hypothetical protein n=1 Tax=Streptomyces sp. NPDC051976 TaxID=3154947 RepID=UPI00343569CB
MTTPRRHRSPASARTWAGRRPWLAALAVCLPVAAAGVYMALPRHHGAERSAVAPVSATTATMTATATGTPSATASASPSPSRKPASTPTPDPRPARHDGGACQVAPADSVWRTRVDTLPVAARSAAYVAAIGASSHVHADFGSGTWDGEPFGIPVTAVTAATPKVRVSFDYASESDKGPYAIPADARVEGGPSATGDRHVIAYDRAGCRVYELYAAQRRSDGTWHAGSGAVYDLRSDHLRPAGWTSADAAGLPIFPGLARYEEAATGTIDHALRITVPRSQAAYLWPARHQASSSADPGLPPMGLRLRLKAHTDISGLPPQARAIAQALKTYGAVVADNGSPWYISGTQDDRWNNDVLHALDVLKGSDFEAVDVSALRLNPDSGAARQP